jgi:Fe2+ or Zn2+ uptake regulation protein
MRKFPEVGSPAYQRVIKQVENGENYLLIAESLGMTFKGFKDALRGHGIKRKPINYEGVLPPVYEFPESASWEEHLRIMQEMENLVAFHQKVPSEITINVEADRPIVRAVSADWHLGAFGFDYISFKRDIDDFCEMPLKVNVGGDKSHNIIQASKIGSSHNQNPISVQKGTVYLTLEKLAEAKSIDSVRSGNHDYWQALLEGEDWDREITRKIRLLYMKHFGVINYKVGNMVYPWLMLHKARYNSNFNLTHCCKQYQRMYYPKARVVSIEHQHVAAIEQYQYDNQECVAIRTGTYNVYDDYAQQNGFFGAHVCNPAVVMWPDKDKIVGFKDFRDAVTYVKGL